MMLSPHFELSEFTVSETAVRQGINNTPSAEIIEMLKKTAELMEQVRTLLGNKPIIITSGYRSLALNRAIGSSDTSQHVQGQAADFTCPGFGSPIQVCKAIDSAAGIPYDQLIHEFDSWTHISWATSPRRMALTINNAGTNYGLA
jgi:zinc D-Ala-D-Ala carboxypeptidase